MSTHLVPVAQNLPHSEKIEVGQLFSTFQEFKQQVMRWAVQDGFKTRYYKSNAQYHIVNCAEKSCSFKVRAHWKKAVESVAVTIIEPNHTTCLGLAVKKDKHSTVTVFFLT